MNGENQNIWITFNEKENLIKEYAFWKLLIKESPNKLARMVVILKRDAFPLSEIEPREMEEYATIAKEIQSALDSTFKPHLVQHMALMFIDKHIHFHVIPRYDKEIEFENIKWTDDNNPNPLIQQGVEVSRDIMNKIIEMLKENLK